MNNAIDDLFKIFEHRPYTVIGLIYPHGYENKCCSGKPIVLTVVNKTRTYSCQCSCNGWCTSGHHNPIDAIMEYEMMCRKYPEKIDRFNDPKLYEKYKKERGETFG